MPLIKLKSRRFSWPSIRWPVFHVPGFRLVSSIKVPPFISPGVLVPKMAIRVGGTKALLLVLLVVGGGFAAAMFMVIEKSTEHVPVWPEAGAVYSLPDKHGAPLTPDEENPADVSQTLQVNLAADARISTLSFSDMDLGKAGLTDCISIERDSSNTTGYLFVDELIVNGLSAPSFDLANAEIATMTLAGQTDGHTNGATLNSTISEITITSERGSGNFSAESSTVDRIIVNLLADANIGTLLFDDVRCSVGGIDLDYIKAGSFSTDAALRVGDGDGIDTADFVINSTVSFRSGTDTLIDTPITVR
jgi:hypothetical protein